MEGEELEVKKSIDELGVGLKGDLALQVADMTLSFLKTGVVPKEALGFSDAKIEAIYGQAYRLYNTGRYQEAIELFRLLVGLDSAEARYTLGLAACFHMLKEYENAAKIYLVAGILDPKNPIPNFHASDCYIQMKDPASAILFLEMAIERSENKPEYQVLSDRAKLTIQSLRNDIEKQM